MADTHAKNGRSIAPIGGFRHNGKTYRTGQKLPAHYRKIGTRPKDPASGIEDAPPNMGRFAMPHVITFQGLMSTISKVYRNPDEAIKHSRENALRMRRDCFVMECLEARQRGTALLNWHLEPEDKDSLEQKELCERLTKILQEIPRFTEYRRNLTEAIWFGRYAVQHKYGFDRRYGYKRTTITGWKPIHGDKLAFRYDDGTGEYDENQIGIRVMGAYSIGDKVAGNRTLEPTDFGLAYFLEPWERSMLAIHKHMIEDAAFEDITTAGSIHGVGIRSRIYWTWVQMQETLGMLSDYLERTGLGFTIYWYPYGNNEAREEIRDIAENQSQNNVILMPRMSGDPSMDSFGIDRIEPNPGGADALKQIIHEFFGHRIKRYVLGQTLTSESQALGIGGGAADVQYDQLLSIIEYDATNLEETITRETVEPLKNWNFPAARDIPVRFKIDTESHESEKKLEAFQRAWDMGCKIKAADVYDVIGASAPSENDEVLLNPQIVQQARLWQQQQQQAGAGGEAAGNQAMGADLPGGLADLLGPLARISDADMDSGNGEAGAGGDGEGDQPGGPGAGPTQYKRMQYRREGDSGPSAGTAGTAAHHTGETKVINGVSYRLNEHSRWERVDDGQQSQEQPAAVGSEPSPQPDAKQPPPLPPQAGPELPERQKYVAGQLGKIDKGIAGMFQAFHKMPSYQQGGEFWTRNFSPEQAGAIHQQLAGSIGKDFGGGRVVDLGHRIKGAIGFSSPAGAMVVAPPKEPGGKWRVSYTVMTGPVQRAMAGEEALPASDPNAQRNQRAVEPESQVSGPSADSVPSGIPQGDGIPQSQATTGLSQASNAPPAGSVPQPQTESQKVASAMAAADTTNQPQSQIPPQASEPQLPANPEPAAPQPQPQPQPQQTPATPPVVPSTWLKRQHDHLQQGVTDQQNHVAQLARQRDELLSTGDPTDKKLAQEAGRKLTAERARLRLMQGDLKEAKKHWMASEDLERKAAEAKAKEPAGQGPSATPTATATDDGRNFHEMTREEFAATAPAAQHKQHIKAALERGERVPVHVLRDYPELILAAARQSDRKDAGEAATESPLTSQAEAASAPTPQAEPPRPKPAPQLSAEDQAKKRVAELIGTGSVSASTKLAAGKAAPSMANVNLLRDSVTSGKIPDKETLAKVLDESRRLAEAGDKNNFANAIKNVTEPKPDAGGESEPAADSPASQASEPKPDEPDYSATERYNIQSLLGESGGEKALSEAGLQTHGRNQALLRKNVAGGEIGDSKQLKSVLATAAKIKGRGNLKADDHEHLKEAIRRHVERQANRIDLGQVIEDRASEENVSPGDLRRAVDEVWNLRREHAKAREDAKADLRYRAGLNARKINQMEDAGKDYTDVAGFDELTESAVNDPDYAHLGIKNSDDLWELLKEGKQALPVRHDEEILDEALQFLKANSGKSKGDDEAGAIPFRKHGEPLKYEKSASDDLRQRIEDAAAQTDTDPSPEQREAGNYRKGKVLLHGLKIAIETPQGSIRSGVDRNGKAWSIEMPWHYGYICRTESEADGDHVDVFLGPNPESEIVFVVDQLDSEGKKFDEHKCMIGWTTEAEAKAAYLSAYSEGWNGFGCVTSMTVEQFKNWLAEGKTGEPVERQVSKYARYKPGEGQKELFNAADVEATRHGHASDERRHWTANDEKNHPRDNGGKFRSKAKSGDGGQKKLPEQSTVEKKPAKPTAKDSGKPQGKAKPQQEESRAPKPTPQAASPQRTKKTIKRDAEGLISEVVEETHDGKIVSRKLIIRDAEGRISEVIDADLIT